MAMRTAAKSISQRLFSGTCNFSEKNLPTHKVIRQLPQLQDEVEELSTRIKSLKVKHRRIVEVANSNRTYLDVTNTLLYVLGGASAVGGYIYGTSVQDEITTD